MLNTVQCGRRAIWMSAEEPTCLQWQAPQQQPSDPPVQQTGRHDSITSGGNLNELCCFCMNAHSAWLKFWPCSASAYLMVLPVTLQLTNIRIAKFVFGKCQYWHCGFLM